MSARDLARERLDRAISCARGYAVFVLDNDGHIEQWNEGAVAIFGYTEAEALGMDGARLFTEEDVARGVPEQELEQARRQGQASDRRWHRRKDGSRFFADGATIAASCDDARVDGFVKILRDATVEKRKEDHLAHMHRMSDLALSSHDIEGLLQALVEQLSQTFRCEIAAVLLMDDDRTTLRARAWVGLEEDVARLTVSPGEGFAGKVVRQNEPLVWHDPDPSSFATKGLRTLTVRAIMGVPLCVENEVIGVVHVATEQARRFDREDLSLLRIAAGRIALAVENARLFVAERQAAHRSAFLSDASALLASNLDFEKTLAEVARVAVPRLADWCAVDLVDENGALKRVAAEHVDPAKIALAHDFHRRYPPREDTPYGVHHVIRTGQPELVPLITDEMLRYTAADDEEYHASVALGLHSYMCIPLRVRGETFGAVTFVWAESQCSYTQRDLDFAEQLAVRAALAIENARLFREANLATRARDAFLAMLSHELRTPMTSILGWVALLQDPSLDEETRRLGIDSIAQSARLQAHLVEDLLDISRTVTGKLHLQRKRIDLAEIARDAVTTLQPQAAAAGVQMILETPAAGTAVVDGDSQRLQQVLSNLLSNALKFTPRGGLVTVRVSTEAGEVTALVSDTGRGIPQHLLGSIFDPFRQVDGTARHSAGGLGLGLAIVRTLVQLHGGSVVAESAGEGQGATFMVRLPRA